jgi:riboflavin synthase
LFTGIIVERGDVVSLRRKQAGAVLALRAFALAQNAAPGDSIAVNGTCLTAVKIEGNLLSFDLSEETVKSTNLGRLTAGVKVNLEPSLRPDGKLGGHFVTGHVDAVGKIRSKTALGDAFKIVIDAPPRVTELLVEKGSVAVDGISLTVVDVSGDAFSVVVIPHTAQVTTIGFKRAGDTVNLEADIIGKYVARFLARGGGATAAGKDNSFMKSFLQAGYL